MLQHHHLEINIQKNCLTEKKWLLCDYYGHVNKHTLLHKEQSNKFSCSSTYPFHYGISSKKRKHNSEKIYLSLMVGLFTLRGTEREEEGSLKELYLVFLRKVILMSLTLIKLPIRKSMSSVK